MFSLHADAKCPNCKEKKVYFISKNGIVDWYSAVCHHCRECFTVEWDEETAELTCLKQGVKPKQKRPWLQKISDAQVEEIRLLWQKGTTQLELSRQYSVSQPTIWRIVRGVAR
jgi:hypothetical protein